jgi:hypothetical protein
MEPPKEFRLLLYCTRSRPNAELIKDLVGKGIDWQILSKLAAHHCVRPMLLQSLKSVCWNSVPQSIQRDLTLFHKSNAQRNLLFTGELLRLLNLFEQNAIPIAAFKGPVLTYTVYGDISLREFSDLDVIVHERDLFKAENILTACGYEADFADRDYRSAFLSYQGQYAFRRSNISVDLHWRLSSKGVAFPLQVAEIWARLENVKIAGRTVPTLAHDDLMLFLAAHGTKEGWRSLVWVCDFAEFLRKYQNIDWMPILDRAQRSHSMRPLLLAITLASELLDAPAPEALIETARKNAAVQALAKEAKVGMLQAAPVQELAEFLNGLNTHDRLRHRLLPVASLLTTRTVSDYHAMPLPKSLWSLYYLTRPFRLATKMVQIAAGARS